MVGEHVDELAETVREAALDEQPDPFVEGLAQLEGEALVGHLLGDGVLELVLGLGIGRP